MKLHLPRLLLTRTLATWRHKIITKLPIYPLPFSRFSSLRHFHKHLVCGYTPYETRHSFRQSGSYPRPLEVKCERERCNYVQFIGNVASPVVLTRIKSGEVMGWTRLAVNYSDTRTTWINLRFWGKLAHIAHQHLQKGNQIYVSGFLLSDIVGTEGGKQQTYCKVVVQQLNFVEKSQKASSSPVTVYDKSYSSTATVSKFSNPAAPTKLSTQETRQAFFAYPKPSEVQWKKEMCNSAQLVGFLGFPVKLTHLKSGSVMGWTQLAIKKSATDATWIKLKFWNELAHIAHQHLRKGNKVYVSGCLQSDTVGTEDGKQQTYYQVVVKQLNFVENTFPSPMAPAEKLLSTQELWQAFFANPTEWWDNRNNKTSPKYPDFKHKDTGEALWLDRRYNPPWVKSQLEILDSRMQSYRKQDEPGFFSYL